MRRAGGNRTPQPATSNVGRVPNPDANGGVSGTVLHGVNVTSRWVDGQIGEHSVGAGSTCIGIKDVCGRVHQGQAIVGVRGILPKIVIERALLLVPLQGIKAEIRLVQGAFEDQGAGYAAIQLKTVWNGVAGVEDGLAARNIRRGSPNPLPITAG